MAEIVIHGRQVEMLPLDVLKGYENNARTHPDTQIAVLANIIREHGFTNPLLIDDEDVILAGHGRALAARKLKMTEVPCVRVSGLTPNQLKAIRLSDNQSGLLSGWSDDLLRIELGSLKAEGFDLALTGFDGLDLSRLFATEEGLTDPDEVPEPPAQPVSQLGDLWRLGEHLIICGSSTDAATVERVLAGSKPHLMVTDPPYGVNYDAAWRNKFRRNNGANASVLAVGKVLNDHEADWSEAWALAPCAVAYVWHSALHGATVQASLERARFKLRAQIVWVKNRHPISRGHYHWQHEPALYVVKEGEEDQWRFNDDHESLEYAVREGATGSWAGGRKQSTVWMIETVRNDTGHSTQKPVECMARPILNNSAPGDHVYEPFSGSGTTIIAAHMNKRVCHAIELSPTYVDMACLRFAAFAGVAPILVETGETFDAVKARRAEVL